MIRNPNQKRPSGQPRIQPLNQVPSGHSGRDEIIRYFEERRSRREIVKTTHTPSGQIIDWVSIESQSRGGRIARPPARGPRLVAGTEPRTYLPRFELEHPDVERGPPGTVPIPHRDFSKLHTDGSLADYLSKHGRARKRLVPLPNGFPFADPEIGGHAYAFTGQNVVCFGGEGNLSAWDPYTQSSSDFSLMQIGLNNNESGTLQTAEGGWQVYHDLYGDWAAHLFVYYTTNGYSKDGDNIGGYNQDVDGWVQYDDTIHPGAISSPTSTWGGDQYILQIKYQFYEGNWWFRCNGRWIGYYPSGLWEGNQSVFDNLGDHASGIAFWGEVKDSEGGNTWTDMGSGYWAEDGWTYAAFQSNLLVQTDRNGGLADYNGNDWASDPSLYDITTQMQSGTSWGSYFWMGGPGAG
jgi:hypothetical protein